MPTRFTDYHEARMHCKRLSDRSLWDLESAERERLGRYTPLNSHNPDHVTLLAAKDEHSYRKGNGMRYDG